LTSCTSAAVSTTLTSAPFSTANLAAFDRTKLTWCQPWNCSRAA
jgi:hypothetical protein